ncbi:cation:proton antiporter [Natrarchaeobaculum sulfurireducens]|uniref:Kef-type K+ transport system, membrane component n=1 Tax=Natrarchaeobaculum sulfurireducens TaxID=2044521 RepID=A0A346PGL4_9EURY|nr:cation:proton antiporter [Natrarchaeobaculum sulfurireducens]AXR78659.1 Kef-type K+ transport system, membrane component [Natrarchaeobaculum sulfurireducens]AXR81289.1 Na+/H+ antiporter [Natrarchaeobaculum sulfurireducens]
MNATPLPAVLGLALEQPVLVFTIAMIVFLVAPLLAKRFGQPGIVGIVIVGALLGPGALGVVEHSDAIELLGEVGLIYLLFTVGLELDIQGFKEAPENAALFGLASFFLPFTVGTFATHTVLGLELMPAMLLSAVFASHTLLAYPIVNRLGVTKNRAVTAVFGGILFTDTIALIVLAIVMGAVDGDLSILLFGQVGLSLVILFGSAWFVLPPASRWFFQNFSEESYFEFLFVMAAIFAAASLAELLDLAPILGAFVAGIALNQLIPTGGTLMNRIEFVGNAFFIPFFLFHVGMLVDLGVIFDGPATLQTAAVIITIMVAAKGGAAWAVSHVQGYTPNERGVIFGLSVGQAAAALAITLVGFDAGLFGPEVLNAVVLMLLVTALVSPWLTERYATQLALERNVEDDNGGARDPNILLPLSHNAELQQRLLDLAFVIKGGQSEAPVNVLTVVQPDQGGSTEQQVADVQVELEELAASGSAAEVPIHTEARVNHNVASGIVQGSVEVQADQIIVGWDATESFRHRIFGSIIDQVLERTTLPVLISRLGHPINTTRRLFVVVPIGADHHEGFYEAVHLIKRIATGIGAELTVLVVEGSAHQFEQLFDLVEEDVTAEFQSVDRWNQLLPTLEEAAEEDDLVAAVSPRRGDVGWHTELEDLPSRLVELPPESFITIHPRQGEPEYDRQYLRFK